VRAQKWRSAAIDLVFTGQVSRVRPRFFVEALQRSRHLADVECFPFGVQPIPESDDLFDL
jgi:hypothetical protein